MAVIYLNKSTIDNITEDTIKKIIDNNSDNTKYDKLYRYYIGEHDILNTAKGGNAPNNKVVANMAKYITDTATGYFIGLPVVYSSQNDKLLETLTDIYNYNDEQDTNAEIAKYCSIYGHCFEMLYVDEQGNIRFQRLLPQDVIMIYENGYDNPIAVIRKIAITDVDKKVTYEYEFWNENEVWYFESKNDKLTLLEVADNKWGDIPFVEYVNNEERMGDFEGVVSLIDAYNKAISNSANMFEYNDNAILKVIKIGAATADDIKAMREDEAIILDDGGDIDWLLKTIDDTALENHKNRLRQDMHTFASVPNLSDEAFGGNLSGVAVSYKLWGLEQICANKERKFKKGLQRRVELMTRILPQQYNYLDVTMLFRRNKPQNILEIAQIIQALATDLSRESRLKMLPTVENVQDELDKLAAEAQAEKDNLGSGYQSVVEAINAQERDADE